MASNSFNGRDILNKLKDKAFISGILGKLDSALKQMNTIGRGTFKEYDELLAKIEAFKEALLDYVLDSMIYLEILKDNFCKKKYQEQSDLTKAQFIKCTLDRIDQALLQKYLRTCLNLIKLVDNLREKYGQKSFVIEYAVLNLICFTVCGIVLGVAVAIVLPCASPLEGLIGGAVGFIVGIFRVGYTIVKHWKQWDSDIEHVRQSLSQIKDGLEKICEQLEKANKCLGKAKLEGDHQEEQLRLSTNAACLTYKDISDLEQYVLATYDGFVDLKKIVLSKNEK